MRYFSLEEAEKRIPELMKIHEAVTTLRDKIDLKHADLRNLEDKAAKGEGKASDLALTRGQLDFLLSSLEEWVKKVEALGAVLKGIDPFLCDFLAQLDGREIYLCWKGGETRISWYHGTDEGFAARKLLPRKSVGR